jgi:cyclopropane fatty-acyl-phospholipid synthase-like methyltransferase
MAANQHSDSAAERLQRWLISQKWFASGLLPRLPRSVRWALRTAYFLPLDIYDRVTGRRSALTPPRSANFTGAVTNLEESSAAYVARLRELAGLTPSSRVLDIGSGMGRLAVGLIPFFDERGSYDGLDIVPAGIKWCRDNITPKHPNCRFHLAEVYNAEYNPKGTVQAKNYKLPFEADTFDLVVLVSVFTHMLPEEVDNYLGEIARVLKPGGRCYATYSLLTDESRHLMASKDSIMQFKYDHGLYWLVSEKVPELAVGFQEEFIHQLHQRHGLNYHLYAGNWCGQPSQWPRGEVAEQDIVVATKRA